MGIYKMPALRDGETLDLEIPDTNVICYGAPRSIKGVKNLEEEIKKALENPIESPGFSELIKADSRVCLLIDDITRITPTNRILPVIVERVSAAGIPDKRMKLIIAGGIHRVMSSEEIEKKVGLEMASRLQPSFHDSLSEDNLAYVGRSSRGTPIWINKHVTESDLIIGIGSILLHPFAGYSGGAKIILPGITGRQTTIHNHNIISENCIPGRSENPIRLDMEEVARKVGLKFKIDVVMNAENDVVGVFAGDFVAEYRRAVELYNQIYEVQISEKADIVLTTTLPKRITFTHGVFLPMFSMAAITKPGGTIIIGCPADEGITHSGKGYEDDIRARLTQEQIRMRAKENKIFEASTLTNLARVREKFHFVIVSEKLHSKDMIAMGFNLERSMKDAIRAALLRHGEKSRIAIIPYGFSTLPSAQ